ncbi:hypothetical protein NP493_2601g00004 [Ridgeia piscesae]|uniref:Fibrinogen C-terminal domain-containing protein n=1 Tax=Ridgeia piscesae TaxID=27915 RepID=A0AAD9JEA4_RIDPI|nr:hypothetical protein NP493_2601g00004 [Ridgeia piscesae]
MFRIGVAVLLVSICLTNGQETGIGLGTCTYSFVVQSPYCDKDVGGDAEADIQRLQATVDKQKETINDIKHQMKAMAREIAVIKSQPQSGGGVPVATQPVAGSLKQGHIYIFMGCPRDIAINVVYFVTTLLEPTHTYVMSFNQSALIDGDNLLLKTILPPFPVFCTIGKYIVIQRRQAPFNLQFNKTWDEYKNGFGDVTSEFWLGLEKLYRITNQPYIRYSIRLEMTTATGASYYYQSDNFYIAGEKERYKIVSIGSATAKNVRSGDFFIAGHMFATPDKDVANKCGATHNGFWCGSHVRVLFNRNPPYWANVAGTAVHTEIKIRPLNE